MTNLLELYIIKRILSKKKSYKILKKNFFAVIIVFLILMFLLSTDARFLDYRPVGSFLISHRMSISNQMEINDPSLTAEEKEQAQAFMSLMGGMGNMEIVVTREE